MRVSQGAMYQGVGGLNVSPVSYPIPFHLRLIRSLLIKMSLNDYPNLQTRYPL